MTTQGSKVTGSAWVNIQSTLSMVVGTAYTLQETKAKVKLVEKATEPADTDPFHVLEPLVLYDYTPATGMGIWVKSLHKDSNIVITEVI